MAEPAVTHHFPALGKKAIVGYIVANMDGKMKMHPAFRGRSNAVHFFRRPLSLRSAPGISRPLQVCMLAFIMLFAARGYGKTVVGQEPNLSLPASLGKVVYQENEDRENRVYIIAQSHRSAISGKENCDCRKVQAEIYRIGEWLIANEKVEALLPEGFFSDGPDSAGPGQSPRSADAGKALRLDDASLVARLSDPSGLFNAERLLYATYGLALRQIEDQQLYFTVVGQLRDLLASAQDQRIDSTCLSSLEFHQKKRSAVILENIPAALASGQKENEKPIRRAMLTIGLAHVDSMIDFLKNGRVQVIPPPGMKNLLEGYTCDLSRLKQKYAVVVIIPSTLVESRKLLRLSRQMETRPANASAPLRRSALR